MQDTSPFPGAADAEPSPAPLARMPIAWMTLLLALFTVGGLLFGLVFLRNVKLLASRGVNVSAAIEREIPPAAQIADIPARVAAEVKVSPPRLPDWALAKGPKPTREPRPVSYRAAAAPCPFRRNGPRPGRMPSASTPRR